MWKVDVDKIFQELLYNPAEPLIFSSGLFLFLFTAFVAVYSMLSDKDRPKIIFVTLFSPEGLPRHSITFL